MRAFIIFVTLILLSFTGPSFSCGVNSHCRIADERHYRIHLPTGYDGKTSIGAIFFAHGLGGNAAGIIQNQNLTRTANRLGVALVAMKSKRNDWNIKNSPSGRSDRSSNEFSYIDNIIMDITRRFQIDKSKLMLAGVSVGGTMTWTMACKGSGRFAAFMPISGTYWLHPPKSCSASPANVIHVHGISDKTVPLKGRPVGSSAHSNVNKVLEAYARIGGYRKIGSSKFNDLSCTQRRNPTGNILEFCLHGGGHRFRAKDIEYTWKRFRELGVL